MISNLKDRFTRAYCPLENRFFDFYHRVETNGTLQERTCHELGHGYTAVWVNSIRKVLRQAFQLGEVPTAFIDIGCGKGRACFYAARSGRFSQVLGIDVSATLLEKANLNLQSFRNPDVRFVQADATKYLLPPMKSLVFMFNPFGAEVMRQFIELNYTVFREQGSILAYVTDAERDVVVEGGFKCIYRDSSRKISLYKAT